MHNFSIWHQRIDRLFSMVLMDRKIIIKYSNLKILFFISELCLLLINVTMTLTHHKTYNHNNQTLQYRVCDQGLQTCQFDYYNICWQVKNIWAPYLSFKLSVRDKTWNWWIFPNRNLEHKYFEKLQKFCYLAKLWVLRSFTCSWKMIRCVVYPIYQNSEHFSAIIY